MKSLYLSKTAVEDGFFDGAVRRILELQRENGAIPWYDGGVIDPWNHAEAAMGLTVLGRLDEARKAYRFLIDHQLEDGSWWSEYGTSVPMDEDDKFDIEHAKPKRVRDTNFSAYPATALWHYYRITDDKAFLAEYWPMVDAAMGFVLSYQSEHGDIRWAARTDETPEEDSLVTGCSSIFKSLDCALKIADVMNEDRSHWHDARLRLGEALRYKPHRFDREWEKKDRFSMDWYYPVLAGIFTGDAGRARLAAKWDRFVHDGFGCRCVEDQPWVTVAESCELALALLAVGQEAKAWELFSWQHRWRDDDGAYWMGYQFEENTPWPKEKPAWTAAAVILAADALLHLTPASNLFTEPDCFDTALKSLEKA